MAVKGLEASKKLDDVTLRLKDDVTLRLKFKPAGAKDWCSPVFHDFTILKVDIVEPDGWATTDPCYHYDHQVLTPSSPKPYTLDKPDPGIQGKIEPDGFTYHWELDASCGHLPPDVNTQNTPHPTPHTAPDTAAEGGTVGKLTLEAYDNGNPTGCKDEQNVEVYRDHLDRDIKNFEGKRSGTPYQGQEGFDMVPGNVHVSWVCHQSTHHAYNGDPTGEAWFAGGNPLDEIYPDGAGDWSLPPGLTLQRRDILACYGKYNEPGTIGDLRHSQIMVDADTGWAANKQQ